MQILLIMLIVVLLAFLVLLLALAKQSPREKQTEDKAALWHGEISKELIVKKSIISISCYHFMVSQRMPLPKRSLEHGSMTSSDLGLNVI